MATAYKVKVEHHPLDEEYRVYYKPAFFSGWSQYSVYYYGSRHGLTKDDTLELAKKSADSLKANQVVYTV